MCFLLLRGFGCVQLLNQKLNQNLRCKFAVGGFAPGAELAAVLGDGTCAQPLSSSSEVRVRWEAGAVTYQRRRSGSQEYFSHRLLHLRVLSGFNACLQKPLLQTSV